MNGTIITLKNSTYIKWTYGQTDPMHTKDSLVVKKRCRNIVYITFVNAKTSLDL